SGKALVWDGSCSSLLELAESQGISLDSGCLAGSCGTCRLAVKSGTVAYPPGSQVDVEEGSCLACVAVPQGDLIVDA
ncbi:MAG: 2Fe-2S iron-sulfur cluster binding domain-containing protein, partial [Planctomycetales bacterium]|nr:2Fe-2S iron-sulfur cluster binding domain-containing protein [Planctomycetales bacterium]